MILENHFTIIHNLRIDHRIFQTYFDKGLVDNLNNQFTSAGHSRRYQYAESLEKKNRKKKNKLFTGQLII